MDDKYVAGEKVEDAEYVEQLSTAREAHSDEHGNAANPPAETDRLERRLVLKQNLTILPLLCFGYFFSYLDRGQIGNAAIMGMPQSLYLTPSQLYNAIMMFSVGYLVAELPLSLLMRAFPAQYVFGGAFALFGLCATLIAFCGGYPGLMVLRTLLGVGEAACSLSFIYLSLWYRPYEHAFVSGLVYLATPIAGFSSGLIAYGVARGLDGDLGYHSWQWLFIIVGIPAIALGLVVTVCLPDFPDKVVAKGHFLFSSYPERALIQRRFVDSSNTLHSKVDYKQIYAGLIDPKTWIGALMIAPVAASVTALVVFLPTFMHEFGYSALNSQLYSIIPFACAIVSTPTIGRLSDHWKQKGLFIVFCMSLTCIGFILLLSSSKQSALMAGCCLIAAGSYAVLGVAASWITCIHGGYVKTSTSYAVAQVFAQGYCILVSQVYDTPPRFFKGHGILLGLNLLGIAAALILYFWLRFQNHRREEECLNARNAQEWQDKTFEELYDYHPMWRYTL